MQKLLQRATKNGERGYTLMFAVITATLVLGVAVFIVGITAKQYELSVQARNSVYSFFAADSGIECAINPANWTNSGGFASTTGGTLRCGPGTVTFTAPSSPSWPPTTVLIDGSGANVRRQQQGTVYLGLNSGGLTTKTCVQVTLTTGLDPANNQPITIIDSRGYNLCTTAPAPDSTSNSTVERALRLIQTGVW
ncbi:MAG TPA: hypothetical protein VF438_00210 [Candidatus Paceibacterota bacterium]